MDDLDLDKINLEDINLDTDSQNQAENNRPKSTNFQTASVSGTSGSENRPRLRKIKRPKSHSGPISNTPYGATQPIQTSGLIRADEHRNAPQTNPASNYPVQNYQASYIDDNYQDQTDDYQNQYDTVPGLDMKKLLGIALGCLLIGILLGKFLFSSEQVVQNGLQGVVVNPEVPKGRSRCGIAEKTQGCVLYIMNPQRQELNGRDFYDLASQLTGRQRFVIETGNMRYSSVKIKPGNIAQLNIPPLQ